MNNIRIILVLVSVVIFNSCEEFLKVDKPGSLYEKSDVFKDDITANYAVAGIYNYLLQDNSFASGTHQSIVALTGLSSDELLYYPQDPEYKAFEQNQLLPNNSHLQPLWDTMYKAIYEANSAIEGINESMSLTAEAKKQLLGETHFIRAFSYFYLVNTFGDVPLVLTSDYEKNKNVKRALTSDIYDQIISDLSIAETNLSENYVSGEKVRPNRYTATALMARVFLYTGNWAEAIIKTTIVIESGKYFILDDLNSVFLANSDEAIFQMRPLNNGYNTNEGKEFVILYYPSYNIINPLLITSFEENDNRMASWIGSFDTGQEVVYYPYKYKVASYGSPLSEYSTVIRFAEMYLIRSEAMAKSGYDQIDVQRDLDVIRARAGLSSLLAENQNRTLEQLLLLIENERRSEFFTEFGHRWFDLKRTNRANAILSTSKPGWTPTDQLYPIPQSEINRNPSLTNSQNPGY